MCKKPLKTLAGLSVEKCFDNFEARLPDLQPWKHYGHVLSLFSWFAGSYIIKWGRKKKTKTKTQKTSWHGILQQRRGAMTLWVADFFFGRSCTHGYSLNSRSWIIDQEEGWRTILAASLTLPTPDELGLVNKEMVLNTDSYGFVASLIQRQRGQLWGHVCGFKMEWVVPLFPPVPL